MNNANVIYLNYMARLLAVIIMSYRTGIIKHDY